MIITFLLTKLVPNFFDKRKVRAALQKFATIFKTRIKKKEKYVLY